MICICPSERGGKSFPGFRVGLIAIGAAPSSHLQLSVDRTDTCRWTQEEKSADTREWFPPTVPGLRARRPPTSVFETTDTPRFRVARRHLAPYASSREERP